MPGKAKKFKKNEKTNLVQQTPINVKIMLFYGCKIDPGHIGVAASDPASGKAYYINFVNSLPSTVSWGVDGDYQRAFEFKSTRTLTELKDWHKKSDFYHSDDWRYRHNCADAVRLLMQDFFGFDLNRAHGCVSAPFSTCLWRSTGISMPRNIYLAAEKAVQGVSAVADVTIRPK